MSYAMDSKETLKIVKKINERMAKYERDGLTDSYNYYRLQNAIRLLGLPVVEVQGKAGQSAYRLSRTKNDIDVMSMQEGMQNLLSVEAMGGLRGERKTALTVLKKQGINKPKKAQVDSHIASYGKLKSWAENELREVYVWTGNETVGSAASELADIFDTGAKDDTYDAIFEAIRKYEEAKEAYYEKQNNPELSKEAQAQAAIFSQEVQTQDEYRRAVEEYNKNREKRV